MVDAVAIQSGVSALKGAIDILKTLSSLGGGKIAAKDIADLHSKLIEASSFMISAQQSQVALTDDISNLKKEIVKMKDWEADKSRYSLQEPQAGVFVYALKDAVASGEPVHWLCATCFANDKKSFLQRVNRNSSCPFCKTEINAAIFRRNTESLHSPSPLE